MRRALISIPAILFLIWYSFDSHSARSLVLDMEDPGLFVQIVDEEPIHGYNDLFMASGECQGCHGHDPNAVASVDANGMDINVVDDWRATMMAMSAKDPFWRAKVSHEVEVLGEVWRAELESSCTDCHAPLGFFNAMHTGAVHYTMADMMADSVALDGVSCGACHQISPDSIATSFSGAIHAYVEDTIYGQFTDPFAGPMQSFVGFMPVYGEHMSKSELCASCHTLITETMGLDLMPNGSTFVEQATYHEWLNSVYNSPDEGAVECQDCHMKRVDDDVVIASNILSLPPRSPFSRHGFVGGNSFMLELMKANKDTLDIRATSLQMDSIHAATLRMLQQETLDLELVQQARTDDSLFLDVVLTNKAGHKFPSGYPSRIAWIKMLVTDANGDTLFASGMLDGQFNIIDRDVEYEPHYDVILAEDQVQIYEMVMADESGSETTILSQADHTLKDNRLVPFGFSDTHFAYDTTQLYGAVLMDDDFNLDQDGVQGSGRDSVSYHMALNGYTGDIEVQAQVLYQVTPPRWLESMFEHDTDEIQLFQWMYDNADNTPVKVAQEVMLITDLNELEAESPELIVYPNPTRSTEVSLLNKQHRSIDRVRMFDSSGRLVQDLGAVRGHRLDLTVPGEVGIYFIEVTVGQHLEVLELLKL